eukprot:s701_g11.t1
MHKLHVKGTSTATFVLDGSWAQYDADQDEQISVEELLLALGGGPGPDSGPEKGPGGPPQMDEEGVGCKLVKNVRCVQCQARRLEILPAGTDAVELLSRRLQGAVELPRRLQGQKCCPSPSQPGGQPTDDEMKQQQNKNQPLATGSQENFCHFTELFDVELGQPDENRFCQKIPESELSNIDPGKVVSDQLKLNGLPASFDLDSVLEGGSQRVQFEEAFIRDLASQLGIPVTMLEVTGVAEGSVVVSFRILPGSQEQEAAMDCITGQSHTSRFVCGGTSVETVTLVPSIVQMSLATVRQTLDTAASPDSILAYTDPAHGVAPTAPQRAQQFSGQEALMQAFDGEALEKHLLVRTVETPEIYSLAPVGIGGRTKVNEYLPRRRASVTQDEKWDAPDKVDIDFAVFITPMHKKVDKAILCPSRAMVEECELSHDSNACEEMMSFKQWRIPPELRMKVLECETFDWLEEVMKELAVRSGKNFSAIQNPYTAERLKDLDATCGIPDDAWINTSCQETKSRMSLFGDCIGFTCRMVRERTNGEL